MTVEVVPTRDENFFLDRLQAAFRRDDGTDKFRRGDLVKFFAKAGATNDARRNQHLSSSSLIRTTSRFSSRTLKMCRAMNGM